MSLIKITIDDQIVEVASGQNLIEAAKSIGVEIPHYCYHPGLPIDGNCRMCLVEIEKAPKPMIACNTLVTEGMVVKTKSEKVQQMRKSVMEFLLINHPLDCPTCDQAGECRLQDYYMTYDDVPSRFQETKVDKDKMVDLGAGVMLDQERCIACTRCIRVCQHVAGQDELGLANRGDHVTITTFPGKQLSNPYAGNTIDVCPVGALTDKKFRYKKRVWLLSETDSICPGCSRGCNISIHHADEKVYRLKPRFNAEVNKYWMCDEGRYNFDFINQGRILRSHLRVDEKFIEVTYQSALKKLIELIAAYALPEIALVGHASQTNENLLALREFAKQVFGSKFYYSRLEPSTPFSDQILITADKNPNQAYLNELGAAPIAGLAGIKALIVIGELTLAEHDLLNSKKIPILALLTSNENPTTGHASVIFPIPTYAEQDGHFTNLDGRKQKITKAFPPKGESQTITRILSDLLPHLSQNHLSQTHLSPR